MRSHAALIMFIGAMLVAGAAVGVFFDQRDARAPTGEAVRSAVGDAQITGVSVYGIDDSQAEYATIEITGGENEQNLSNLALTLSTDGGSTTQSP